MIRFDVEARLKKIEADIVRRETQLRPLRRERRILREMLTKKQTPPRRRGEQRETAP